MWIDHTIIPSEDKEKSAEFYARIFGFEDMGERPNAVLHPVRVNDSITTSFAWEQLQDCYGRDRFPNNANRQGDVVTI
jgi:catechol 2,3-dioxygenase-like lactoylglutathione lyase family enzyme